MRTTTEVDSNLLDNADKTINPATEDKQNDIIAGVEAATDMNGKGKIPVGTTAVEVTFTGTPTKSITITSDIDNAGVVYVGKSNVTSDGANSFTLLQSGEAVQIDYDDVDNAVYVVASMSSQNYWSGALL